ncbi:MAG: hypothetical protein ABJB74_11995 [Gemmatimonas sp.]
MNNAEDNSNAHPPFSSVDAEVKQALASMRRDHFTAGFEDRALARWNRERALSLNTFSVIERLAWRLLPLAVAASLLMAVYSAQHNSAPTASLLARSLGWQSAVWVASVKNSHAETYESVYSTLYGLPLVNSSSGVQ